MPLTLAHPNADDSLILFADLQKGIADLPLTMDGKVLGKAVSAVASLARLRNVPVIVSTVPAQEGQPQLIEPLESALGEHRRFVRTVCDSAQDPEIMEAIERSGRKKVLISGVATEIAVSLPALTLLEKGYAVFVIADAVAGLSARTEEAASKSLVRWGATLTPAATMAGVFAGDFSKPEGQQALGILYGMVQG